MKKGNRPTTLAYSDNFLLNCLAKNYNGNKNHMGAAPLRPTWCLQSTLSTLQAWKKVQHFCEPDNCLLLFGSHASNVRQLQLSVCTTGLCVAPRTHVTGGRLENPPFYLQSTPKETAVSRHTTCSPPDWGLGPYNRAPS